MKPFKIHCSQINKILGESKPKGGLPVTCQTFLKEWYAGDHEEIFSKELQKGVIVEPLNIDLLGQILDIDVQKNELKFEDEYFIGTCDVDIKELDMIADIKSPWNNKTFQKSAMMESMDENYEMQGRGYMRLYNRSNFLLFYGLQNTPAGVNYGREVTFDHLDWDNRWVAFKIKRDVTIEQEIIARVIECRKWLEDYHQKILSTLGKIH